MFVKFAKKIPQIAIISLQPHIAKVVLAVWNAINSNTVKMRLFLLAVSLIPVRLVKRILIAIILMEKLYVIQ